MDTVQDDGNRPAGPPGALDLRRLWNACKVALIINLVFYGTTLVCTAISRARWSGPGFHDLSPNGFAAVLDSLFVVVVIAFFSILWTAPAYFSEVRPWIGGCLKALMLGIVASGIAAMLWATPFGGLVEDGRLVVARPWPFLAREVALTDIRHIRLLEGRRTITLIIGTGHNNERDLYMRSVYRFDTSAMANMQALRDELAAVVPEAATGPGAGGPSGP